MSHHYGLELSTRPDLPAVVARWQREITPEELRLGYQAILSAADECGCHRWLLDLRRRNEMASDDISDWMTQDFFPMLAGRFPLPVRVAFLVSPLRVQQTGDTRPDQPRTHAFATFTEEAAAYEWLAR